MREGVEVPGDARAHCWGTGDPQAGLRAVALVALVALGGGAGPSHLHPPKP